MVGSDLLEVDALDDRQALEKAAQTVECKLGCTEAHPFAAADDAGAAERDVTSPGIAWLDRGNAGVRNRDPYGAAKVDAVRALVQLDQHRQRVRWRPRRRVPPARPPRP